jgi:pyruvate decarboxylase
MIYHSQTGYIGISEDVAYAKIPASLLEKKLNVNPFTFHATAEETAVTAIIEKLKAAKKPIVMVDGGAARTSWAPLADPLLEALGLPFFTTVLGKGIANEENPLFGGVYAGHGSMAHAIKAVKDSDCILWLGNYPSDFNTYVQ